MKSGKPTRASGGSPQKIANLRERIVRAVSRGKYVVSNHAYVRAADRLVPIPHVEHVLLNGFHEKRKDTFKEEFHAWNYSIRGKSPDRVNVRVVVSFTNDDILVVTVINLDI